MSQVGQAPGREAAGLETFPLTEMQKYLLPSLTDPDAALCFRRFFNFAEGIRIKPGVSPRRVERSLKKLVKRHDVLRLAFRQSADGEWRGVLLPQESIELEVTDHGNVSDAEMRRIVADVENETMDIDAPGLTDFRMLKFGDLGDVIFIRLHHALTDAFGFMVLVEDLIRLAINQPILGKGYAYADFMKKVEGKLPDHSGETGKYWDDLLMPPPPPVDFGRLAKGLPETDFHLIADIRDVSVPISPDDFERVIDVAQKGGASVYTLTAAGLAETMHEMFGVDEIIGRSVLGRSAGELSNFIGFALRFPLFRAGMKDGDTLLERAASLRLQMRDSMSRITKELGRPQNIIDDAVRAANGIGLQYFVHVPAADARAKQSVFATLFRAQGGTSIQVGPIEVERMHFPRPPAIGAPSDLTVLLVPVDDGAALVLRCDATVFEEGELQEMAERIAGKLIGVSV